MSDTKMTAQDHVDAAKETYESIRFFVEQKWDANEYDTPKNPQMLSDIAEFIYNHRFDLSKVMSGKVS